MTAPEIPDTQSPYWLRLYGHWLRLEGVGQDIASNPDRQRTELITVDGYRYVQQAPRGPRTWELNFEYTTAAATAALESAAYANNYNDPTTRTLFLNTNEAKINMVQPDLNTLWSTVWRNNVSSLPPNYAIVNVGEAVDKPIWQPTYDVGSLDSTNNVVLGRSVFVPVRAGVTYTAVVWTVIPNPGGTFPNGVLSVWNGVTLVTQSPTTVVNGGTGANPDLVTVTFTAASDYVAEIYVGKGSGLSYYSAGLMFYEGDCDPDYYRNGRRMPCQVEVQESAFTQNLVWYPGCDPCALPREQTSVTLREVGTTNFVTAEG